MDLASEQRRFIVGPSVEHVQVAMLWGGTAVGEHVAEVGGRERLELEIPEAVRRQAVEIDLTHRLRPRLAPAGVRRLATSVVVCTFGRPDQLEACLESIAALATAPDELVVVDNDPSDPRSAAVALRLGARVVAEPERGLSRARNAGARAATGEVVAFLDDDCRVERAWLDGLASEFDDPLVAAVVGYVGAGELETGAQWLFEEQGGFERRHRAEIRDGAVVGPWGAAGFGDGNVFFRRAAFERVGGYAQALGPGTPARSAQDADMLYRIMAEGWRVAYSPARVAWHRHRRELEALAETLEGYMTGLSTHAVVTLARRRDPAALRLWWWMLRHHFPRLARDAARHGWEPGRVRLLSAQVRGALLGPWRGRHALSDLEIAAVPALRPGAGPRLAVMSEAPTVSVAIASRDRRERLLRTLEAFAGQAYPSDRMEVVAVLDGCCDDSGAALRGLQTPWVLRVHEQPPAGLAIARNRGAELARNDLLLLWDDDIVPAPDLVAEHARAHGTGRAAIVMGVHPMVPAAGNRFARLVRAWWEDHFRRKLAPGWQPSFTDYCDGNSSLSRRLLERLGGFDEAFSGGRRQDWELAIRALGQGVGLRVHGAARGTHHPESSFAGSLRTMRQEGHYDVLIARAHPDAAGRLPLCALARDATRREAMLRALASPVPDGAWVAAVRAAELGRSWATWMRLLLRAQRAAYLSGVADGVAVTGGIDEALERVRLRTDVLRVGVEEQGPPLRIPPAHVGRVELELAAGQRRARLEATVPAETWDAEDVLARAATALAAPRVTEPPADRILLVRG